MAKCLISLPFACATIVKDYRPCSVVVRKLRPASFALYSFFSERGNLPKEEKDRIFHFIDLVVRDYKAGQAYAK